MIRFCEVCSKEFTTYPCEIKIGKGKYCSRECAKVTFFKKGQPAWNKGISPSKETREKWSLIRKGKHNSPETEFKPNQFVGENHPMWKGDFAKLDAKHIYMKNKYGTPKFCEGCGNETAIRYEWANISGEYKRDRGDWLRLCKKCHNKFDNISEKSWKTRHERMVLSL